ncbi:hypothetical protein [Adhaeribacter radiodurans]|uniref:Uncharacterized protein n=1 Tax=Adhaeribacter radiodurans TaxID=2745197 RepID=A0A7L7L381_9BACT|nr:hypothetical protein [Adhaeribacter radiodurans]QMU27257.1 hypothetical protein HUW48_04060 [Adhaeribacter radiodurans]
MKKLIFLIIPIVFNLLSCKKDDGGVGKNVEIYLLKNYQVMPGKCQVNPLSSVLQDTATVKNQDILQYSKTDYQFKLSDIAIQKVKTFKDKTPFAVTVDKQVVYYGFFKPNFSSSSCDNSITMDITTATENKISVNLGYPGPLQGVTIDDQRNNPNLIRALKNQGKLN